MNDILFSIIVPIYNVEEYLDRCVQSILSQTYDNFELILVDDGSPDSCPQICDGWKMRDERVKVIHKQNGGLSDARNTGLNIAKGEYVLFIDSDDYWCENDLLEKIHIRYQSFREDIVLFGCKIVDESGVEEITRSCYDFNVLNLHDKSKSLDWLFATNNMPGAAWIYTVSRNLIESLSLRFIKDVTAEDFEWIISTIVSANTIGAVEGVQYAYIRRGGSITTRPRFSGIQGIVNALVKYEELNQRYPAIDKYLARIFLLALMSYNQLLKADKQKAAPLLKQYTYTLKRAGQNKYYWFVRLMGLTISSFAIRKAYNIVR